MILIWALWNPYFLSPFNEILLVIQREKQGTNLSELLIVPVLRSKLTFDNWWDVCTTLLFCGKSRFFSRWMIVNQCIFGDKMSKKMYPPFWWCTIKLFWLFFFDSHHVGRETFVRHEIQGFWIAIPYNICNIIISQDSQSKLTAAHTSTSCWTIIDFQSFSQLDSFCTQILVLLDSHCGLITPNIMLYCSICWCGAAWII